MKPSNVVIFEGQDCTGKTTMIDLVSGQLTERGVDHIVLREPGGTALGEHLRETLLTNREVLEDICPTASALMFLTARAQLLEEKIQPALARGQIVLMDRFDLSTVAYQSAEYGEAGYKHGLTDDAVVEKAIIEFGKKIKALNDLVIGGLPRRYVLLTADPEVIAWRMENFREKDRFEERSAWFRNHVASVYEEFRKQNEGDKRVLHVHDEGKVFDIADRVTRIINFILQTRSTTAS